MFLSIVVVLFFLPDDLTLLFTGFLLYVSPESLPYFAEV